MSVDPAADLEFCKLVESCRLTSLSFARVKQALLVLDPTALDGLSFFSRVVLFFSFSNVNRRKAYLLPYFLREQKRIEKRSASVVTAFNTLFSITFPEMVATSEEFQVKKTLLIDKAKFFPDLKEKIASCASKEDIQILEAQVSDRLNQLLVIKKKAATLALKIQNAPLTIPHIFLNTDGKSSKEATWNRIKESLLKPIEIGSKASFEDHNSFTSYIEEESNKLKKLEDYYLVYEQSTLVANALEELVTSTCGCYKPLYDNCSIRFIGFVEDALLSAAPDIIKHIQNQKERILKTDKTIQGIYSELKRKSIPIFNEFLGPALRSYPDLFKMANTIVDRVDPSTVEGHVRLTDDIEKDIIQKVSLSCQKLFEEVRALLKKGYSRNKKMEEIESFQKKYQLILSPMKSYLDLKKTYEDQEKIAESLSIKRHVLLQLPATQIDQTIDYQYENCKELIRNSSSLFTELVAKIDQLEISAENAKQTLKLRLFEVFTETTPFPDLLSKIKEAHKQLQDQIIQYDNSFYNGQMLLSEYKGKIAELAYEHDVVLIRNEFFFRAENLHALRQECRAILLLIQLYRRLLEVIQASDTQTVYKKAYLFESEMKTLLHHLENPFDLFYSCLTQESVQSTFTRFRLQIEQNKSKVDSLKQECLQKLKNEWHTLKNVLLAATDDLEEVLKSAEGVRPNLFTPLKKSITEGSKEEIESILEHISTLEKNYPFIQPFAFYLQLQDRKVRREFLLEVKQIYTHICQFLEFAKNVQYIKTFEEKRVDSILEAFDSLGIFEEENGALLSCKAAFIAYKTKIKNSIRLVEEEVLLDIGLLDNKAILAINDTEIKEVLRAVLKQAKKHVLAPEIGTYAQLESIQPESKSVSQRALSHLLNDILSWTRKKPDEVDSTTALLEELSFFCRLLFLYRAYNFAKKGNALAIRAKLFYEMFFIIHELENILRAFRKSSTDELEQDVYFINECHELRKELQKLDTKGEDPFLLKPRIECIFDKIALIPEIKKGCLSKAFDLTTIRNDLLSKIEELNTQSDLRQPLLFHYIPGYLAYFK